MVATYITQRIHAFRGRVLELIHLHVAVRPHATRRTAAVRATAREQHHIARTPSHQAPHQQRQASRTRWLHSRTHTQRRLRRSRR